MQEEVYLVMSNRQHGLPSVVKTSDHEIFFSAEDAEKHRKGLDDLAQHFGVYRALIEVKEKIKGR